MSLPTLTAGYRTKSVPVEAAQWDGTSDGAKRVSDWLRSENITCTWVADIASGYIQWSHGEMKPTWWLIRDPLTGFKACAPWVFSDNYEPDPGAALGEGPTL